MQMQEHRSPIIRFVSFSYIYLGELKPRPHWDQRLAHAIGRVSILIGVIVLCVVANMQYVTSDEVTYK